MFGGVFCTESRTAHNVNSTVGGDLTGSRQTAAVYARCTLRNKETCRRDDTPYRPVNIGQKYRGSFLNVVLEKDGEDQLGRSCEKLSIA